MTYDAQFDADMTDMKEGNAAVAASGGRKSYTDFTIKDFSFIITDRNKKAGDQFEEL